MKKILYFILVLLLGIFIYSCEKDFLDRTPLDEISDPDFWKTQTDLELYLNRFYDDDEFEGWWPAGGGMAPTLDNGTDMAYESLNVYYDTYTKRLDGMLTVPASGEGYDWGGGWDWENIRNINYFLANADRVEESGDMVDHYIGEGHCFRAIFYYALFRDFGALPIITEPVEVDDENILYGSRSSRTEVFDFILSDLDEAISKMKYGKDLTHHQTRLSKDIALVYKARACLFEGTWEKYHQGTAFAGSTDGSAYLQMAADAAKQVIDDGNYSLVTGDPNSVYFELFNKMDYTGNPEVMFFKHYDRLTYGTSFSNQMWNWPNGYGWTHEILKNYLCADGLPIAVSPLFQGDDSLSVIEINRDPRLAQSIMVPGDPRYIDGTDTTFYDVPELFGCPTGYESQKFRYWWVDPQRGIENHDVDYIFMRFAEPLLIYAEAKAELGTITQGDVDMTINQLRDRVDMPHLTLGSITVDPNWPDWGYALSDILQEIRRERVVELLGEGRRFEDLMRWRAHNLWYGKRFTGTFYTPALKASNPNIEENAQGFLDPFALWLNGPNGGYGFNANRDYLAPLPINELTLNPNLDQNPGWE